MPGILISYAYFGTTDLDAVMERAVGDGPWPELWMDSGAFTAMTKGRRITCEEYADWLHRWEGRYVAACNLDVIGDPVGTMLNQSRLEALGCNVLPVYHMRANRWHLLDELAERYPYICVGGMAGTGTTARRVNRFLAHALERIDGRAAVHALGTTSDTVLNRMPVYSADCSSWNSASRWGYYPVFDERAGRLRQIVMRDKRDLGTHGRLLREHGVTPRELISDPPFLVRHRIAVAAYAKRERWVRERQGVVERPDRADLPGLRLYLAVATPDILRDIAMVLADQTAAHA